jgi:hypothetical protein
VHAGPAVTCVKWAATGTQRIFPRFPPNTWLSILAVNEEATMGRGALLWLIGIPLPIILIIWLFGGLS